MGMFEVWGSPERTPAEVRGMLERKEKLYGFGHPLYRAYDPRAVILKRLSEELSTGADGPNWFAITDAAEQTVFEFIEAGASGYTLKQSSLNDLLDAIEIVYRGEAVCSPRVAYSVFARIAQLAQSNSTHNENSSTLTIREEEILQLIVKGLTNKQIADKLYISFPTVKNHVHNILEKLGIRSRAEAVNYALRKEKSSA